MNQLPRYRSRGDLSRHERGDGDYHYVRFVKGDEDTPYDALYICVTGRHKKRRVTAGLRHYYVVSGIGTFTVNDETRSIQEGDMIVIYPGESYSYEGTMELFEFNIDTGDGIKHEDLE